MARIAGQCGLGPRGLHSCGHYVRAHAAKRDAQDKKHKNEQDCFAVALVSFHCSSQPGTPALLHCLPDPQAAAENRWRSVRFVSRLAKRFVAGQIPPDRPRARAKERLPSKTNGKPEIQTGSRTPRVRSEERR